MSIIGSTLGNSIMEPAAQSLGEQAGYWMGEWTGYNERLRKDQQNQEKALTDIQKNANFETMNKQQGMQQEMFDYTFAKQNEYNSPEAQMQRYKDAGMNPGLMYSQGAAQGAGGTTGNAATPSAGKGNASDESSRRINNMQAQGMAMQLKKLASEIAVNESISEVNKADAMKKLGVDTRLGETNIKVGEQNIKTGESTIKKQQAEIEEIKEKVINIAKDTALKEAGIKLNEKQIEAIENTMHYNNEKLVIDREALVNAWNIGVLNNSSGILTKDLKGVIDWLEKATSGDKKRIVDWKE